MQLNPNIPCGSRVMSIFTDHDQSDGCSAKPHPSKKGVTHANDNDDMHTYAKFDQNIPYGSRVISIFTNW